MQSESVQEQAVLEDQRASLAEWLQALNGQAVALQHRLRTVQAQVAAVRAERRCVLAAYRQLALDDPARTGWEPDVRAYDAALLREMSALLGECQRLIQAEVALRHERSAVLAEQTWLLEAIGLPRPAP
jgi:hypothetical protein